MMCADFSSLKDEVGDLNEANADIFYIDIMDGEFVPNFGMGLQDFQYIHQSTNNLIDVHLMIQNPGKYVEKFADLGAELFYIHPEADMHPARTLDKIRQKGKLAGLAINPGTSIDTVKELFHLIDYLMIMTVNPGLSGQQYLTYVNPKIEASVKYSDLYQFKVMVDGAITEKKIEQLHILGVEGFVLGTATLFGKDSCYKLILNRIRKKLERD